jgi:hypothetical protein
LENVDERLTRSSRVVDDFVSDTRLFARLQLKDFLNPNVLAYRARCYAVSAAGALLRVNRSRLFTEGDREVTGAPAEALNFGEGVELDVVVPARLNEFWRDNAH